MTGKITPDTIISGIMCNVCGKEVPAHTAREHLEVNNPIHQCPHPAPESSRQEQ